MQHFNNALKYVDNGLLNHNKDVFGGVGYNIFCYSREVFLSGEWDDVTTSHRGKVYRDDGTCINHVFPKIFNLGERPETSTDVVSYLLKTQPYCVMDKANGHLVILSHDRANDNWILSTKGSLSGEMATQDQQVFDSCGYRVRSLDPGCTLLFECIAEHDVHSLFEEQRAQYSPNGKDCFVLLGGYSCSGRPYQQNELYDIANRVGCPLIYFYDPYSMPDDLHDCLDHKGIEGYVFWFYESDFRVKIKTREYWQMRFKKDLTPSRVVGIYCNQGPDALLRRLPEEVDLKVYNLVNQLAEEWYFDSIGMDSVPSECFEMTGRDLFMNPKLSEEQCRYIHAIQQDDWNGIVGDSRPKRNRFLEWFMASPIEKDNLASKLLDIVNSQ